MGDPGGIGPEIAVKTAEHLISTDGGIKPVIIGSFDHISRISNFIFDKSIHLNLIKPGSSPEREYRNNCINVMDFSSRSYEDVKFGVKNPAFALDVEAFIAAAVNLSKEKQILGFATAPINKDMMLEGGARFGGHTELIGHLMASDNFAMLFYSQKMAVILATIHIPLSDVPKNITTEVLKKILNTGAASMVNDFGIKNPSIAVLGLNPHAGENGKIGMEEKEIISPSIEELRKTGLNVQGPFPADSFFAKRYMDFDLIVSMYHDQALIPFKLLSFSNGVNVTTGLDIIRTSPVHGTGYEIAGKNIAEFGSMLESVKLAFRISKNRKNI